MNREDAKAVGIALEISLAVMEELSKVTEIDDKLPIENTFDLIREWKRKARLYDLIQDGELKPDEQLID